MEAGRQEKTQWGARWFWTELVPRERERRGHGHKVNEIRRQHCNVNTEEEAQLHRLLMPFTTCEPRAESWGMEAHEGKSKEGDTATASSVTQPHSSEGTKETERIGMYLQGQQVTKTGPFL